jgi:hypothetical protein
MRLNSNGSSSFCSAKSQVKIFDLKSGSVYARKCSAPNQAWSGATWPVISLAPFSKEILTRSSCFRPSLIRLSGVPSAPKDIQQVYRLNWEVFCALIRSDIIAIFTCLDLDHAWVLITYLLDHAGISTSANDYYNIDVPSSKRVDRSWNMIKKRVVEIK